MSSQSLQAGNNDYTEQFGRNKNPAALISNSKLELKQQLQDNIVLRMASILQLSVCPLT